MPYSVSKTALLGLTKALSFELGPENIRVNCIAPGIIDTKFSGAVSLVTFLKIGSIQILRNHVFELFRLTHSPYQQTSAFPHTHSFMKSAFSHHTHL